MGAVKQPPSTGVKLLRALIAAAFGVVLAMVMLEVALRVLNLAPPAEPVGNFWQMPHPDYGWYHIPNATGLSYDTFGEYQVPITINSQGLRDEEIPYEKPAGVFRILLLGDSFAEGMRTELAQTTAKVLQARLNEMAGAPRFQVVNAGVGAWGTDQQLLWLRNEGVKYDPDLVLVLFFTANDFMNNSELLEVSNVGAIYKPFFALKDGKLTPKYYPFDPEAPEIKAQQGESQDAEPAPTNEPLLAAWRPRLQRHSALYRFLAPRLQESPPALARWLIGLGLIEAGQAQKRAALGPSYIPVAYGVYAVPQESAWEEAARLTSALFEEMNAEANKMGAGLAVVIANSQEQVIPQVWDGILQRYPAMQARSWDLTQPNRDLARTLNQANIPYLDLLSVFQTAAREGERLYLPRDGHWTAAGEKLAGETIAEFVRQQIGF